MTEIPKSDGFGNAYWWDGPDRFENVNRNIISWAQHEVLFNLISALAPKPVGIDVGGTNRYKIKDSLTLNIDLNASPDILGRGEQLPVKTDSLGFIISSHTVEHIKNTRELIQEWVRTLVLGGLIAFTLPDKNYFLHNKNNSDEGVAAVSEMSPEECLDIVKELVGVEIVLFNTRKNNFDFEVVIRKK